MLVQINITELGSFLKYGVTGLSAIAFILTYFLLFKESSRPKPRQEIIKTIRLFMWVTIILGVVSGVSSILKPNAEELPRASRKVTKAKVQKASFLPDNSEAFKVEVFYEGPRKADATDLVNLISRQTDYEVVKTPLTNEKKTSLKIHESQIRHELSEQKVASKLKSIGEDVTSLRLKQITSHSPNYVSVFICE